MKFSLVHTHTLFNNIQMPEAKHNSIRFFNKRTAEHFFQLKTIEIFHRIDKRQRIRAANDSIECRAKYTQPITICFVLIFVFSFFTFALILFLFACSHTSDMHGICTNTRTHAHTVQNEWF